MTPPPRKWIHFSVRTLLVVVTVLCCWLSWNANTVHQRTKLLGDLETRYQLRVTTAADYSTIYRGVRSPEPAWVSFTRRLLGDRAIQRISYDPGTIGHSDIARLREHFPEAEVSPSYQPIPCHPGCFPWGTQIETPKGRRQVEQIQIGDEIVAILRTGEIKRIAVTSIFRTRNKLLEVQTTAGVLLTTPTQPLCVTVSKIMAAGELKCGDQILIWSEGKLSQVGIKRVTVTERVEPVVNLVLCDCEAFIANGFLARSKPPADSVLTEGGVKMHEHSH